MDRHDRDSLLVNPHATHQPFGPKYLHTSTQGLVLRLLIRLDAVSTRHPPQRLFDPCLEFSKSRELFKQTLIQVLEIDGQRSHADGVA